MKPLLSAILVALLPFVSFISSAQTTTIAENITATKLFEKGMEQYNKKNFDSAIIFFKQIADNNIARGTSVFGNALFNIPTLYFQLNNIREAKQWYLKVIASDVKDNDETGSIMEPHANYKYKSAVSMANIYALDSNYKEMLNWLFKADTVYPYWGFEGSATNTNQRQSYLLSSKALALQQLNKKPEAIREIITTMIYATSENFFGPASATLLEMVDKDFITAFDEGLNNMSVSTTDSITWKASFGVKGLPYKLIFTKDQSDLKIPHFWHKYFVDKDTPVDKLSVIALIRRTEFYKSLKAK